MLEKRALTETKLDEIISKRWSCRAFNTNKKVSREQIISLCEAGRWAPSCFGDEPWRFIVFDKNSDETAYNKALYSLGEWNQKWAKNAPVLIFSFADTKFRKTGKPNRWAQYDTGAASENICLQAVSLGLMAHQMGGFDEEKVMKDFNIPENFIPMSVIAIGYQSEPEILEEEFKTLEIKERFRRPIGDTFFLSEFGNKIK
ncbi:MAG: nitroreductase family protein [bacterium]